MGFFFPPPLGDYFLYPSGDLKVRCVSGTRRVNDYSGKALSLLGQMSHSHPAYQQEYITDESHPRSLCTSPLHKHQLICQRRAGTMTQLFNLCFTLPRIQLASWSCCHPQERHYPSKLPLKHLERIHKMGRL